MKTLADLITNTQPSIVAMQSGVLVLFMASFLIVILGLLGDKKRQKCEDIGRRALED